MYFPPGLFVQVVDPLRLALLNERYGLLEQVLSDYE